MIELTRQSAEVYFAAAPLGAVGHDDIAFLKAEAAKSSRKRCRICLHLDEQAGLHETVLVYTAETFNRPNRHPMAESFHILEGKADVVFFHPGGMVDKVLRMGDMASGLPFICQFPIMVFHTMVVRSKWLVIHETCRGPFVRGKSTMYASWAPRETDAADIKKFLAKLDKVIA